MHYFKFRERYLYCEKTKVLDLADKFGTPLYVYSLRTLIEHFCKIKEAFKELNPLICYSVKANSNLAILKSLIKEGAGLDIVSGGELYRAKKVKCSPQKIVYASVGKTAGEIKEAIKYKILMFNAESVSELGRIDKVAQDLGKKVDVALRINPDIEVKTHRYIITGAKETKFGISLHEAQEIFRDLSRYKHLNIIGLHIHIGSQIVQVEPFLRAVNKIIGLLDKLARSKIYLKYLNIGGGLGIIYDKEKPQTAQEFARRILPALRRTGLKIILEPGRFIVGNAGILLTRILYIKETQRKRFIIVDAAMNDLIRPALYNAYHKILPLSIRSTVISAAAKKKLADIVGPVCETADFLGKGRVLDVEEDSYLAVMSAGAYGFVMASNYNSRARPAEVLVNKDKFRLIRRRETYKDLINKEIY